MRRWLTAGAASVGLLLVLGSPKATALIPLPTPWPAASSSVVGSASSGVVLKTAPGLLWQIHAECSSACWLMVFNSTALPTNGSTTAGNASGNMQECFNLGTASPQPIHLQPPEQFTVGITAVISSTACATLTLATTGFINAVVQ